MAAEVASALGAPLDVLIARKLGHPDNPEYAIGAVTDDGELLLNEGEAHLFGEPWLAAAIQREAAEARRRREAYVGRRTVVDVAGRTAIVVDDGIATGFTVRAAVSSLRKKAPARVIVAAPVAPPTAVAALRSIADEVVVLVHPTHMSAIGAAYEDFSPVSDRAVKRLLRS